jgi:hypothetical protein
MDDVGSAAVQFLSGVSAITSLLGAFSESDPVQANQGVPYIFLENPLVVLQGSGQASLVCSVMGGWSTPVPGFTARFTRLSLEFYVDPQRDSSLNITESPGLTILRGERLFSVVNSYLHRRDSDAQVWGDLVTTGCTLLSEGQWIQLPTADGDWLQHKQAFYGITSSGWTDVAV